MARASITRRAEGLEKKDDAFFGRVGAERTNRHAPDAPQLVSTRSKQEGHAGENHRAWASSNDVFWGVARASRRLPAGVYRMGSNDTLGPVFLRQTNDTDTLVVFPDSPTSAAIEEIDAFLKMRDRFRHYGLLFKRGMMFWGPPGGGKTTTVQMIIRMVIERYAAIVVFIESPGEAARCLHALRRMEPERLVLAVMEDVEVICDRHSEHELLSLMDGEMQIDGIVYLATTNYPEKLDPRLVDRPSRIDSIRYIGMPTERDRRAYFKAKLVDSAPAEVKAYVSHSEGYSVAYMRELIVLTKGFGNTLEYASGMLNERRAQSNKLSSQNRPDGPDGAGFTGGLKYKVEMDREIVRVARKTRRPVRVAEG